MRYTSPRIRDMLSSTLIGAVVVAGVAVLSVAPCKAAAAAPSVRCDVEKPHVRGDGTLDLLIGVNVKSYTGRPFAFSVVSRRWREYSGAYEYASQRYSPVGRGHHTNRPVPRGFELWRVDGGAFGTKCKSWQR